jgi:hypothetical protein
MDALQYLPIISGVISALLGGGTLTAIVLQIRLWRRDTRQLDLARHMFDQTRSTDALSGYARMLEARTGKGSPPSDDPSGTGKRLELDGPNRTPPA